MSYLLGRTEEFFEVSAKMEKMIKNNASKNKQLPINTLVRFFSTQITFYKHFEMYNKIEELSDKILLINNVNKNPNLQEFQSSIEIMFNFVYIAVLRGEINLAFLKMDLIHKKLEEYRLSFTNRSNQIESEVFLSITNEYILLNAELLLSIDQPDVIFLFFIYLYFLFFIF